MSQSTLSMAIKVRKLKGIDSIVAGTVVKSPCSYLSLVQFIKEV